MYTDSFRETLRTKLDKSWRNGTFKRERVITTRQGTSVDVLKSGKVLNFCSNNYLGLSGNQRLIDRASRVLESHGFGLSSVRFISGTQDIHKELEKKLSDFLLKDDTILYSSCFDANGGLFAPLLTDADAIISDQLNHASIIDGIRLSKAKRYRYSHSDIEDLESVLIHVRSARIKAIVTDGVFSMDGEIAPLPAICDLAEKYGALLIVDDSHATGFVGESGRGSIEYHGVTERVDIVTSTLGKALGGASGGFTAGPAEVIEVLRQHSRPYLFSNTLAPVIVGTTLAVIDLIENSSEERDRLRNNQRRFRKKITEAGFSIIEGDHPIVPVLFGHLPDDAAFVQKFADELLRRGIYATGFFHPVVPEGESRIRVQLSAAHTAEQVDICVEAFKNVGKILGM